MDIMNAVAENAKAIRKARKLTLDAAAELTGVSRSMLAQIERGDVNPTISVLWKIANGYKVSFTALLEEERQAADILRAADARCLEEDAGRYLNYPTFQFGQEHKAECYRIVLKEGGGMNAQPHLKGAEEYITVFSGQVEIRVEEAVYRLTKGDSIRFFADVPHAYHNMGAGTVEMSMVIYYSR